MGLLDWFNLGGDFLGGIIDNFSADMRAKKDREWNSREAEKNRRYQTAEREAAQEWNLEQWNRENEYNSPAAQMQRAIEAGMNPNAAIQGISGSSNAGQLVTSGQSGSAAGGKMNNAVSTFGNSVNDYWSAMLAKEQIKDTMATRPGRIAEIFESSREKSASADEKRQEIKNKKQEYKNLIQIADKLKIDTDAADYALNRARRFEKDELESVRAYTNTLKQQYENMKKSGELIEEQKKTEQSQQAANYASANSSNANAEYTSQLEENAKTQKKIAEQDLSVATVKAQLANDYGVTNATDADAAMMIGYVKGTLSEAEFNRWLEFRLSKRDADNYVSSPWTIIDKGADGLKKGNIAGKGSYKPKQDTQYGVHTGGAWR